MRQLARRLDRLLGTGPADRVVPPSGHTAWLTVLAAAAMAFLAVFALALALATGRLADRWADTLARAATIRLPASAQTPDAQVAAILAVLATTPGVASARAVTPEEQAALLEPWLGADLALADLPLPRLVEVVAGDALDAKGLALRLAGEVPGAVYDDHARWRRSLVDAADRLRDLGWIALALIAGVLATVVTLAAQAALAANAQVIGVLRLVGARDLYVVRAFTRRFTLRAGLGAALGTALGVLAVAALPDADDGGFLTGLGFRGAGWLLPLLVPAFAAAVAYVATRIAAFRALSRFE